MGYDRGDSFLLDFEPNGNPFGSKSNEKLSVNQDHIPFNGKENGNIVFSVYGGNLISSHVQGVCNKRKRF